MTVQETERLRAVEVMQQGMKDDLTEVKGDVKSVLNSIGAIRENFIKTSDFDTQHANLSKDVDRLKKFMYISLGVVFALEFVINAVIWLIRK